jgi:hypothetical protein
MRLSMRGTIKLDRHHVPCKLGERSGDGVELGTTRVRLPFGGIASTVLGEVQMPKVRPFYVLTLVGAGALLGFVCLRVLLW